MWEYRWAEVEAGSGPDERLTLLGAEGWEAVGMDVSGVHLGKTWVRVLLKRPAPRPDVIDLTAAASGAASPRGADSVPGAIPAPATAPAHLTEPAAATF